MQRPTQSQNNDNDNDNGTEGFGTPLGSPAGIDTIVNAADNDDLELLEGAWCYPHISFEVSVEGKQSIWMMFLEETNEEGLGDSNNEPDDMLEHNSAMVLEAMEGGSGISCCQQCRGWQACQIQQSECDPPQERRIQASGAETSWSTQQMVSTCSKGNEGWTIVFRYW
jgi:hypothetical protein